MTTLRLDQQDYSVPSSKDEFKGLVDKLNAQHGNLRDEVHFFVLSRGKDRSTSTIASMVAEGKFSSLHLLFEVTGRPDFRKVGFVHKALSSEHIKALLAAFSPFENDGGAHPNIDFLKSAVEEKDGITCTFINKKTELPEHSEALTQLRTTTLFNLFNEGALRGNDGAARQALLDSFSFLPNRYMSAEGEFIIPAGEEPNFIRQVPAYTEWKEPLERLAPAGMDKFPSLMSIRAERLKADGNRIIPGAMIRDGVHVGKRNIFMFHAAVNIAAYLGDDNLVDSHASVGSAAQIGNKNKIASFVSLEGVLSPANAQPVLIGDENFLGSFVRVGTGLTIGNKNLIGSGVNLSAGTKIRDCREDSATKGSYLNARELNGSFNNLTIVPNNAAREFHGVQILPGEYILFANSEELMARFEGDSRIKAR